MYLVFPYNMRNNSVFIVLHKLSFLTLHSARACKQLELNNV